MKYTVFGLLAAAQIFAAQAELSGTIYDPAGRAVANARAEAQDQATMARYAARTDDRGEYHILGLPTGK